MKVRVRQMCRNGQMLPEREIMAQPAIEGELLTSTVSGKGWARHRATLRPIGNQVAPDVLLPLWQPELEAIASLGIRLRGLQETAAGSKTMVMQIWLCDLA